MIGKRNILLLAGSIALALCAVSFPVKAEQERTFGLFLNDPGSYGGYTLFAPLRYDTTYLIDEEGRLVHSWVTGGGQSAYLLEDGTLIRSTFLSSSPRFTAGGAGGRIRQFAWDGTLVWDFEYSTDTYMSHHDIEVLPNGNVLAIAWELKSSAEAIAAGRDPALLRDGELWPEHIIEVEPTGATTGDIVWEWHMWDHLIQDYDPTKDNYDVVADHPELIDINFFVFNRPADGEADWIHANAIDYNEELEQIVLSARHFGELWVIDHSTTTEEAATDTGGTSGKGGDLLYRWGNPQAYGAGDAADQKLFLAHDTHWIEPGLPGEGNIMVFNNGNGRPGGDSSSVDEIVPPVDGSGNYSLTPGQAYGPADLTWTYAAPNPTDFYSRFVSGAVRLPNGNTLIDSGAFGDFFEVTPDGTIVWRYVNPVTADGPVMQGTSLPFAANAVFRAYRYAADFLGLAGKDLTPGGPLELLDTDKDGCTDGTEVQTAPGSETTGGQRDPLNPWDYFDTNEDQYIDLPNDIQGVMLRYSANPQLPYDVAYDRGQSTGPYAWNMTAPDAWIDLPNDILGVIFQYQHDCR